MNETDVSSFVPEQLVISSSTSIFSSPTLLIKTCYSWSWTLIYFSFKSIWLALITILLSPFRLYKTVYNLKLSPKLTFLLGILVVLSSHVIYSIVKNRILSQYKNLHADELNNRNESTDNEHDRKSDPKISTKEKYKGLKQEYVEEEEEEEDREALLSSYLDQFLSALKIFGYLEKPVFHDLTKNMKTQKLDEGEILLLDNSIGFAIVVEGTLQIYHEVDQKNGNSRSLDNDSMIDRSLYQDTSPSSSTSSSIADSLRSEESTTSSNTDFGNQPYGYIYLKDGLGKFQLLNTVKPGNPVTSLVNILNLFTSTGESPLSSNGNQTFFPSDFDNGFNNFGFNSANEASALPANHKDPRSSSKIPSESPGLLANDFINNGNTNEFNILPLKTSISNVVARAATDCTIAIIPPQAFANLTVKYPRSVSHIIQIILTKLYHVTFQTAHDYLGLTREIMQVEYLLNKSVNYELPYYLKEAVIRKLKQGDSDNGPSKSKKETHRESQYYKKRPEFSLDRSRGLSSRHVVLESRDHLNPGDLLSNVPLSRKEIPIRMGSPLSSTSSTQLPILSTHVGTSSLDCGKDTGCKSQSHSTNTSEYNKVNNRPSFISNIHANSLKSSEFSSTQEETEDSTLRMALTEAMFSFLGVNEANMSINANKLSSLNARSNSNFSNARNSLNSSRPSDLSLINSFSPSSTPPSNIHILPSDYAITYRTTRKQRKKSKYREEIGPNLDFGCARKEFADAIQLCHYNEGEIIVKQDGDGKGLFYVISGEIEARTAKEADNQFYALSDNHSTKKTSKIFTIHEGGIAGYLSCLVGYRSFVTLKAKSDVYVGFLPNETIERLCDKYFLIYLRVAETLTTLLSHRMLKLDHALEWVHLSASETLFSQGDPANGIYVVLNGRLRQYQKKLDSEEHAPVRRLQRKRNPPKVSGQIMLGELGQGGSFGEVEVLTALNRISTMVAVRDSELARIPRTLFELLALEYPSIMIRVSRLVAKKILTNNNKIDSSSGVSGENSSKFDFNILAPPTSSAENTHTIHNNFNNAGTSTYRTITILPITEGLPVESFALKLVSAFKQVGQKTIGLTQRITLSHLGRHAFDKLAKLKQSGYFSELEQLYDTVVYIADTPPNSSWTKTCVQQADCVLLLADADGSCAIGANERLLLKSKTTARTELILLHEERYVEPGLTQKWLRKRPWLDTHYHIQFLLPNIEKGQVAKNNVAMTILDRIIQTELGRKTYSISRLVPDTIRSTVENFSSRFKGSKSRYYNPAHTYKNDFLRLARILSGQAVGLVLGGGGARGISHLGVLQAIEEQGIPIDVVGGTSIGSFIGGLYAKDYEIVSIYGRIKNFSGRVSSLWRMITDLTWPVTSYTTGHEFNRGIWKAFGETRIEDFWLQYYCNSTNITDSIQEIHSFGYAWRYIRASMSLAGLLPPLEENGAMLLDGGYVDNLPVWEMKALGCKSIFAVDVGSVYEKIPMKYGDSLNGFWIILNRWNPFSSHPNIPSMAEIQTRLGYVASVSALEKAKRTNGVVYVRPPIEGYGTLDFQKFEEIYQVGASYGRVFFQDLLDEGRMPIIPGSKNDMAEVKVPELLLHRRNSI